MTRPRLMVALALLGFAGGASAQVGKWVDTRGRVYYGDQPPPAPVMEKTMAKGTVSAADGAHFQAAPAKWAARRGGGPTVSGIASSAAVTSKPAASGGYRRCGR